MSETTHFQAVEKSVAEYADAKEAFEAAEAKFAEASREKTSALNRMNDAQKAFDAATAALAKSAPRESDWASRRSAL